jgi:hypothetical protein
LTDQDGQKPSFPYSLEPVSPPSPVVTSLRLDRFSLHTASPNFSLSSTSSKKNQGTEIKAKRFGRMLDQIHDDMKDKGKQKFLEDLAKKDIEDLPGMLPLLLHYLSSQLTSIIRE